MLMSYLRMIDSFTLRQQQQIYLFQGVYIGRINCVLLLDYHYELMTYSYINYIYKMGDSVSVEKSKEYIDTLQFVQIIENGHFGAVEIFRSKEPPYEYVMNYKKTFNDEDKRLNKYMQIIKQIINTQHKNLAKIHLTTQKQEILLCIKHMKVNTYTNYYNFTLAEAIDKKKAQQSNFPQSQLIYIMGCLLQLGNYLKQFNISIADYRTSNIYLSPEGYIKIYLLELEEENRHSSYFKALVQKQLIDSLVLAPEQLICLQRMEYQTNFDVYKADVFAIAMILLELITLDKNKFYYNESRTELKMGRIQFDISTITQYYSCGFITLLKSCLQVDPNFRISFEHAVEAINNIKKNAQNTSYCIRLAQDEQKMKNSSKKQSVSVKGKYILNGLEKKLMPTPINTLSSSTSSNFRVESRYNKTSMFLK